MIPLQAELIIKKMQHWLFVQTTAINVCQSQKQSARCCCALQDKAGLDQ